MIIFNIIFEHIVLRLILMTLDLRFTLNLRFDLRLFKIVNFGLRICLFFMIYGLTRLGLVFRFGMPHGRIFNLRCLIWCLI